jgi:hypothetical protein
MNRDTQLIWEAASEKILERDTPQRGAGFISHRAGDALKELVDAFEVGNRMDTEEAVLVTQIRAIFNSNNHDVQNAVIDLLKALSNHSNPSWRQVAGTILTYITDQS